MGWTLIRSGRAEAAAALVALLCGCATVPLQPAPGRLAPWTAALRDQQPDGPFAAVYRVGRRHLVFVGAQHANATDSPTFRMIADAYAGFDIGTVLVEGFATSRGANAERLLAYASRSEITDGFQEGGETVPTVLGAVREGATFWGGEPDNPELAARLREQGVAAEDLLGFYTLRSIPQWIRERKIEDAADPRLPALIEEELALNRARLALEPTLLPDYAAWASWYEALNGKRIGAGFAAEEAGPLADGPYGSNKVAAAVSRARAAYLHSLILAHLNRRETVLVVFGASHLMIHRPALDAVLGPPCYAGAELAAAPAACRG